MEMNFPHPASRQAAANNCEDHKVMLATAIARQTNSWTARAMAVAGRSSTDTADTKNDMVEQLIHYFGSDDHGEKSPSGAFWTANDSQTTDEQNTEPGVYQNASTNIKAHDLNDGATGEQSNHAGHGASRILC